MQVQLTKTRFSRSSTTISTVEESTGSTSFDCRSPESPDSSPEQTGPTVFFSCVDFQSKSGVGKACVENPVCRAPSSRTPLTPGFPEQADPVAVHDSGDVAGGVTRASPGGRGCAAGRLLCRCRPGSAPCRSRRRGRCRWRREPALPATWQTWSMWSTTVSRVMPVLSAASLSQRGDSIQASNAAPMTPPRSTSAWICRSSSWRSWSHRARQQLWVAMTRPPKASRASRNPCSAEVADVEDHPGFLQGPQHRGSPRVRPPGAWVPWE